MTIAAKQTAPDVKPLSKPQVRILAVLIQAKDGLTRQEISDRSETDYASLNSILGCNNEELLATDHFAYSLLRRGLVKAEDIEGRGRVFVLNANGYKAAGS
jgi:hypothetical protein